MHQRPEVTATNQQDNVARVRDFVHQVQEQGHLALFDEFVHPSFRDRTAGDGAGTDRESSRDMMTALHAALADRTIDIVHCFEHGDVVATMKIIGGRHVAPWRGQPPTGSRVQLLVMDFIRLDAGRMIEHWAATGPLRTVPAADSGTTGTECE